MAVTPPDRTSGTAWAADSWSVLPWNRHWPLLLPAVGKRLRWRWGHGPVSFRLESLSVVPGWAGRLRSVRATATEVDIAPGRGDGVGAFRLDEVHVEARNVRVRTTSVRLEHVAFHVHLGQAGLDSLLDSGMPYAQLELTGGVGLARLVSRPGWGHVELTPSVVGGGLVLLPTALVTGAGTRWPGALRLLPRVRIGADVLLPGSRLVSAAIVDDQLRISAVLEDIALPLVARTGEVVVDLADTTTTDGAITIERPGTFRAVVVASRGPGPDA